MNVIVTTGEYESGKRYWLVRYRLPNGELVRKFFPDKQSAEDYAECRRESPDEAIVMPIKTTLLPKILEKRYQERDWF